MKIIIFTCFIFTGIAFSAVDIFFAGLTAVQKGDYKKGLKLLEMSCKKDNISACELSGGLLSDSPSKKEKESQTYKMLRKSVPINNKKAIQYFTKACNSPDASVYQSCIEVADFYLKNNNINKAKEFYQKGCNKDYKYACNKLKEI